VECEFFWRWDDCMAGLSHHGGGGEDTRCVALFSLTLVLICIVHVLQSSQMVPERSFCGQMNISASGTICYSQISASRQLWTRC
jgi:hypothetical protein